jgi:heptosyltransferase-2
MPVTVIFCSTVPAFGFGPLSTDSRVVQTELALKCRPCGVHGFDHCPEGHFDCARSIGVDQIGDL